MIRDLRSLYVAIKDNEVIAFDTNLKDFLEALTKIEPELRNYQYYYRKFQKVKKLDFEGTKGIYTIQKVL